MVERREPRLAALSSDAVSEAEASSVVARLRCGRRKRNMTSSARKKAKAPNAGYTTPLNWLAVGSELMMYTRSVGCTSTCPGAPVVAAPPAPARVPAPAALLVDLLVADMDTGCRRDAIVRRLFVHHVDVPSGCSNSS